jgi:hypothetical protein
VFLSVLIVILAVDAAVTVFSERKYKDAIVTEKMQCRSYYQFIVLLWSYMLAVLIMCLIGNISLKDIGFRNISFEYNIWFTVVTFIFSGTYRNGVCLSNE